MIRHDFITRAIILMITNLDINKHPKWISYEDYYKYLKIIIKKNTSVESEESSEDNIIKIINELDNRIQ